MMQTEVGEIPEPRAPGHGEFSTLPQTRDPVGAAAVGAAERHATALVGIPLGGAWQALRTVVDCGFPAANSAFAAPRRALEEHGA